MTYNKSILNEDIMTRNILNKLRNKNIIKESTTQDAIAITNDPKFGQEVLKNQIDEFRSTVDGGAQFATENSTNPSDSPLVYIPSTGNLVFSGTIPAMNNLKWQFSLKDSDGTGLFIWVEGLRMNKENIQTLNKLYGHYQNWKNQWEQSGSMLENLGKTE
jgi:hypothetical protein